MLIFEMRLLTKMVDYLIGNCLPSSTDQNLKWKNNNNKKHCAQVAFTFTPFINVLNNKKVYPTANGIPV